MDFSLIKAKHSIYYNNIVLKGVVLTDTPYIANSYNQIMGGVDVFDQELNYYSFQRKSCRWTYKLSIYLLQTIMLNSFVFRSQ